MKLSWKHRHTRRQSGFSLLELLVAFAIMAMSLGLLYRLAGGSARSVTDASVRQQAVALAQSILDTQDAVGPKGWNEDGESAGFTWTVQSSPYPVGNVASTVTQLHQIQLTVQWTAGTRPGKIELLTLLPQRKPRPGETLP